MSVNTPRRNCLIAAATARTRPIARVCVKRYRSPVSLPKTIASIRLISITQNLKVIVVALVLVLVGGGIVTRHATRIHQIVITPVILAPPEGAPTPLVGQTDPTPLVVPAPAHVAGTALTAARPTTIIAGDHALVVARTAAEADHTHVIATVIGTDHTHALIAEVTAGPAILGQEVGRKDDRIVTITGEN